MTPNSNPGPAYNPGDPDMVDISSLTDLPESRALPWPQPSPWSGYPDSWATPNWESGHQVRNLVDVAWACIDLNSSVLSSMPVYRLRNGNVIRSLPWMVNPDPTTYSSWQEFAKQLFWDYHLGEAFILAMAHDSDGYPIRFRVIPPWLINVEINGAAREYTLGAMDVTKDILHIRYQTTIDDPHGHGPLESAADRAVTIGLLQRYTQNLAETGGVPLYWLGIDRKISQSEATDLMDRWIESRSRYAGQPALVSNGATLHQAKQMNASEISLLEMTQFAEARLAILLGVPPFLVGLPGATGSLCVDTETEILTRTGWKKYDEVVAGDETLTLDQETGISEWQPILNVSTFDVVDRNMISMEMIGHSSFSTDDHQWPVVYSNKRNRKVQRRLRLTRDLTACDALITAAPCSSQPDIAKYSDAFVELAAWWYTEGNSVHTGTARTAWLAQSETANPEHCARIRMALTSLFGPASVTRNKSAAWSEYVYRQVSGKFMVQFRLNGMASDALWEIADDIQRKVLSREFIYNLTPAQLELFIQVSIWADGCEAKFTSFKQADEDRLEIFELACWLSGRTTQRHNSTLSVTVRKRQGIKPVASNGDALRAGREPLITKHTWTGRVWCPTTPNQTWYARRNGTQYFTHNTYSNIEQLFGFHDRSSLRPKANAVMGALSQWALPGPQSLEMNRDDYTRPSLVDRAKSYKTLIECGVMTTDEARAMERLSGEPAASRLTGGMD